MRSIKILNSISYGLIPVLLAVIYLIKDLYFTIPIFIIGIIVQVILYFEYKKNGTNQSFIKNKVGGIIVSLLLMIYLFVKNV